MLANIPLAGVKAARGKLLEMESNKRKMREEIGNSSGAAGKALDALRDSFDATIGKVKVITAGNCMLLPLSLIVAPRFR